MYLTVGLYSFLVNYPIAQTWTSTHSFTAISSIFIFFFADNNKKKMSVLLKLKLFHNSENDIIVHRPSQAISTIYGGVNQSKHGNMCPVV